jgi:ankyrin repeat protein
MDEKLTCREQCLILECSGKPAGIPVPPQINADDPHEMRQLIRSGAADLSARDILENTYLHLVVQAGELDLAKRLLQQGAIVNARNSSQETPLLIAIGNQQKEMTLLLLGHGGNVHLPDQNGHTPLHAAAHWGDEQVVRLLLAGKPDVNARYLGTQTALTEAITQGHDGIIQLLLDAGAEVRDPKATPLRVTAHYGYVAIADLLLAKGADIQEADERGTTPLHAAVHTGHVNMVRMLVERGADVAARDQNRRTPIELAVLFDRRPVVAFFKDHIRNRGLPIDLRSLDLDRCDLPPDSDCCKARMTYYYFDPAEKRCRAYTGCGGVVPFGTMEACKSQCESNRSSVGTPTAIPPSTKGTTP